MSRHCYLKATKLTWVKFLYNWAYFVVENGQNYTKQSSHTGPWYQQFKARLDGPRKMHQPGLFFTHATKHTQLENSISYCVLRSKLYRSERTFNAESSLQAAQLDVFNKL